MYNIILALPKVLLEPQSWFWQNIIKNKNSKFQYYLYCIAINKIYIIWEWRDFWKEYQILGYLKDIFPTIPIVFLSIMIIPNILEYIWILLKLFLLFWIYKRLLHYPNLTYIKSLICKSKFKDLDFFILSGDTISKILKTMIWVNKIDNIDKITKFSQSRLSKSIWKEKNLEHVIHPYLTNFTIILSLSF